MEQGIRNNMTKTFPFWLILAGLLFSAVAFAAEEAPKRHLRVANWSSYIDIDNPDESLPLELRSPTLRDFAEKFNCTIEYHEFDSPLNLILKFSQLNGFYDIMVASCNYSGTVMPLNVIMPFDESLIPNLRLLDDAARYPPADIEGRFLIPYLQDYLGLAFRKDTLGKDAVSWNEYYNPPADWKGHVGLMDIASVMFASAVISAGGDFPNATPEDLAEAHRRLANLFQNFSPYISDDPTALSSKLGNNEIWVTPLYAPDAQLAIEQYGADKIGFIIPEEGSEYYFDYFIINRFSKNKETAHLFINYMLEPEVSGRIAAYLGSTPPSAAARAVRDRYAPPRVPSVLNERGETLDNLQITFALSPEIEARWLALHQARPEKE